MVDYEKLSAVNKIFEDDFKNAFNRFLESGWYILGNEVKELEKEFAAYLNTNGEEGLCVGVASGLDALILGLEALGLPKESEVLVPANTYIASILAIIKAGFKPVLVEPDEKTLNINPNLLESKLTNKTKAVLAVHLYGKACQMDKICDFCSRHNLRLVEDCAQSHGAKFKNKMTGTFGDIGAFSFYPTKNLGALGDAGLMWCKTKELADKARALRNYGSEVKYHNKYIGINSRLDELQASFLRIKLSKIEDITAKKRMFADMYFHGLDNSKFTLPVVDQDFYDVFHIFAVRCERRDELKAYLLEKGIKTEVHYPIPPVDQEGYKGILDIQGPTPISSNIANTILSLPCSFGNTKEDIEFVIKTMNEFN